VIVATIRALKYNGGADLKELSTEDLDALKKGIVNLEKHIENIKKYGLNPIVTLNSFASDTEAETNMVKALCDSIGCCFALSKVFTDGGEGGKELANAVLESLESNNNDFKLLYEDSLSLREKVETVAKEIYGAGSVSFAPEVLKTFAKLKDLGFDNMPVCMAKTQYSLSDDPTKLGRPEGFEMTVRDAYVSAGAGFVVALTGQVMTMPGLPKSPAAYRIDVDDNGRITGLF
jgi:formate--tetrahydrofolate ligase